MVFSLKRQSQSSGGKKSGRNDFLRMREKIKAGLDRKREGSTEGL